MLNAIEFQAKIQNGLIQIPEEYKQELGEGDDIKSNNKAGKTLHP